MSVRRTNEGYDRGDRGSKSGGSFSEALISAVDFIVPQVTFGHAVAHVDDVDMVVRRGEFVHQEVERIDRRHEPSSEDPCQGQLLGGDAGSRRRGKSPVPRVCSDLALNPTLRTGNVGRRLLSWSQTENRRTIDFERNESVLRRVASPHVTNQYRTPRSRPATVEPNQHFCSRTTPGAHFTTRMAAYPSHGRIPMATNTGQTPLA